MFVLLYEEVALLLLMVRPEREALVFLSYALQDHSYCLTDARVFRKSEFLLLLCYRKGLLVNVFVDSDS